MTDIDLYKLIWTAGAAFVTYFFGLPDIWLMALIAVIVIDYVSGLCKAYIRGELSSRTGFKGIVKKLMYFAIVAVAVIADNVTGASGVLRVAVIGFLIANEGISILENCAAAGLPVPKMLIWALDKLKDAGDQEEVALPPDRE